MKKIHDRRDGRAVGRAGFWMAAAVVACLLWSVAFDATASIRKVGKGDIPELGPDEGLLVVDIDSSIHINSLRIARQGHLLGGETITNVPGGKSRTLYVVTAGEYRWDQLGLFAGIMDFYFDLGDDPELHFQVKPGVINYAGDFIYRPGGASATFRTANRGLGAIDWLRANAPGVYAKYHFVFTGHYPDPFPDFYAAERSAHADKSDADLGRTLPPPDAGKLPIPVEDLWRESRAHAMSLNPRGDLLAEAIFEDKAWKVEVIDLKAKTITPIIKTDMHPEHLDWNSDQVLVVTTNNGSDESVYIERIGDSGAQGRQHSGFQIHRPGHVLQASGLDPGHLLFECEGDRGAVVFLLDISNPEVFSGQPFTAANRVSRGLDHAVAWITDGSGALRGAIAKKGDHLALFYGTEGNYRPVLDVDDKTGFQPLQLSADGSVFYGLVEKDRGQRDLVEFDPATGKIGRTVFSKPGFDVEGVRFDAHHRLIGALYYENGQQVVAYFDHDEGRVGQLLADAFPGLTVNLVDRDDAGKHYIIAVEGSDQPVRIYHFDLETSTASLLEDSAPWLADRHLAQAQAVHAKGSDGQAIEAYLTLPSHVDGKVPLVVYSHGGPIGVRDTIGFDPAVQLFASLGYAVLQVNFRGSDGYGRAFREAGERHYGSLIEDDIDAATRQVLAQFPIDPDRLCAVGGSYGGYSALVSAIRWPQRFRCAVSIAGVSDQMLMFTASDSSWTADKRKMLEKVIGNPATDADSMRTYSPFYRYKELAIPVMLAHGTDDERVDYENSLRLIRMLDMAGRPPVMLSLEGEGHGGFNEKDNTALWTGVGGFLRAHLDAKAAAPAH